MVDGDDDDEGWELKQLVACMCDVFRKLRLSKKALRDMRGGGPSRVILERARYRLDGVVVIEKKGSRFSKPILLKKTSIETLFPNCSHQNTRQPFSI